MIPWDAMFTWFEAHETMLGWLGILSLIMFVGTLIAIPLIIVALPKDFLSREEEKVSRQLLNFWYAPYWLLKNTFGVVFIITGMVMLVLPGQGLLTILIGLGLITFPGKQSLIRKILGNKRVIRVINSIRAKFNKPPVIIPGETPPVKK